MKLDPPAADPIQREARPGRFADAVWRGFAAMPLPPRAKAPNEEWAKYREHPLTDAQAIELDATDRNVGIITGQPSGIIVLDTDGPEAEQLARERGWIIPTLTVATGRGKHHYYLLPEFEVRNSAGKLADNVDVRGEGGFVVGAGSIHPNGHRYELLDTDAAPAVPPPALVEALRPAPRGRRAGGNRRLGAPASGEVERLYQELLDTPRGRRNAEANRVAFRVGQLVAAGRVGPDAAEDRLRHICEDIGLEPSEIDHILPRVIEEGAAQPRASDMGVQLEDFHAFMPSHNYIFAPSGEAWPSTSVNARIPPVPLLNADGEPVLDANEQPRRIAANVWLDQNRPVEQMTWAPGEPQVIRDRLVAEGGWINRVGCNVFNQYRPPSPFSGDPEQAGPWLDHVRRVYPGEAEHLIDWLAHRVQRPEEKINHAIVMGGAQGIGKDTILEPVKAAIGHWNFVEVSPQHMLGRFNGFVKSVILRVSEARDLGDVDRFAFYDHMKTYTAAPPDVLRVDEKFMREYSVFNVCGVVITSNHKTNGLYLPEDDRRHFVAWSELGKDDFSPEYWRKLWGWYLRGGVGHVATYLAQRDLSRFEAKAPPPKTEAFWDIVASNSAPEDDKLADALDKLNNPGAVTIAAIIAVAESSFADWLRDHRNARKVPHKIEECGYRSVRNPNSKRGRWKVDGKDMMIYARKELSVRDQIIAAEKLAMEGSNVPF